MATDPIAEPGYLVLVRIHVPHYRRLPYIVACDDKETALAIIRRHHADDGGAEFHASPMPAKEMERYGLQPGDVMGLLQFDP